MESMKWIGISGGWRKTNQKIENDVRNIVSEIMQRRNGVVSGGALNVDYIALDEALKHDKEAKRIKIFIPTNTQNIIVSTLSWGILPLNKQKILLAN